MEKRNDSVSPCTSGTDCHGYVLGFISFGLLTKRKKESIRGKKLTRRAGCLVSQTMTHSNLLPGLVCITCVASCAHPTTTGLISPHLKNLFPSADTLFSFAPRLEAVVMPSSRSSSMLSKISTPSSGECCKRFNSFVFPMPSSSKRAFLNQIRVRTRVNI